MPAALLLLALLSCASRRPDAGTAAAPAPAPTAAPAPAPSRPLNLWELSRDGRTSWLLGTCHVGVPLDQALPAPQDALPARARVLYTEAELDIDGLEGLRLAWSAERLSARLPPEAFERLLWAMPELPASVLEHLQPWVALTLPGLAGAAEAGGGGSMDRELQRRAARAGVPSRFLETLDEQVALLRAAEPALIAAAATPPDPAEEEAAWLALDDYCLRGRIGDERRLVDPDDPGTEALLFARNRRWMDTLRPELAEGGVFVAVGAAHMLGAAGLLRLLGAEGYTVTRHTTTLPAPAARVYTPPAPPPEVDRAALGRLQATLAPTLADGLCADGSLARSCMLPEREACLARMRHDVELCLTQQAPGIARADGRDARVAQAAGACAITGVALESALLGTGSTAPACAAMNAAILKTIGSVAPGG